MIITSIIVSAYLCIGIVLVFFGPLASRIKDEMQSFENKDLIDIATQQPVLSRKEKLYLVVISISVILLWSVFIIDQWWLKRQKAKKGESSNDSYKLPYMVQFDEACRLDPRLYFFKMGGAGVIECQSCHFKEEVISFIHGVDQHGDDFGRSGCQCMSCGKFTTLINTHIDFESTELTCECGGILSDQKPVFCPKCKWYEMKYVMSYIT